VDPFVITLEQVSEALGILGVEDIARVRRVEIEPGKVTVTRFRRDSDGNLYVVPGYDEIANEMITIAVKG
jgi:hypothetical protein